MNRCALSLFGAWILPIVVQAQNPEPVNQVQKRLEALLEPRQIGPRFWSDPQTLAMPGKLAEPFVLPPKYAGLPPRITGLAGRAIYPHLTAEPTPLLAQRQAPTTPDVPVQPTTALVNLPSIDAYQPSTVPILGQPVPNRASLADATLEASVQATLKERPPGRTIPAPFVPQGLPDPFENSQVIRLRIDLGEGTDPTAAPPRPLIK